MAHLVMKSGLKKSLSAEQGVKLWQALRDPTGLDDKQLDYLANIKAIYLNWRTAPDEYIQENLTNIIPLALSEWSVDAKGNDARPATNFAWKFAKRWGLWEFGAPTLLVTGVTPFTEPAFTY